MSPAYPFSPSFHIAVLFLPLRSLNYLPAKSRVLLMPLL